MTSTMAREGRRPSPIATSVVSVRIRSSSSRQCRPHASSSAARDAVRSDPAQTGDPQHLREYKIARARSVAEVPAACLDRLAGGE
jgi:hypothetical protein